MEEIFKNPDLESVREVLDNYASRPFVVQITGDCSVNYQGRAKSKLDAGQRFVIIKQDNALLVHGPENYQPKNWQPETDEFSFRMDSGQLVLVSRRFNPKEVVEIRFESVELVYVTRLVDDRELVVRGHEVDIHEAIEGSPEIVEEDLCIVEREKETDAGFIDVFARDSDDNLVVIEVKRNPDHNSVLQLSRYIDEIEKEFPSREIRGILVAPKISDNVVNYLEKRDLEFIKIDMEDVIPSYEKFSQTQSSLGQFGSDYRTED